MWKLIVHQNTGELASNRQISRSQMLICCSNCPKPTYYKPESTQTTSGSSESNSLAEVQWQSSAKGHLAPSHRGSCYRGACFFRERRVEHTRASSSHSLNQVPGLRAAVAASSGFPGPQVGTATWVPRGSFVPLKFCTLKSWKSAVPDPER